jgi:hypothetical protein
MTIFFLNFHQVPCDKHKNNNLVDSFDIKNDDELLDSSD